MPDELEVASPRPRFKSLAGISIHELRINISRATDILDTLIKQNNSKLTGASLTTHLEHRQSLNGLKLVLKSIKSMFDMHRPIVEVTFELREREAELAASVFDCQEMLEDSTLSTNEALSATMRRILSQQGPGFYRCAEGFLKIKKIEIPSLRASIDAIAKDLKGKKFDRQIQLVLAQSGKIVSDIEMNVGMVRACEAQLARVSSYYRQAIKSLSEDYSVMRRTHNLVISCIEKLYDNPAIFMPRPKRLGRPALLEEVPAPIYR